MEATLQNVLRQGMTQYRERHRMSIDQHQAVNAIMACRSDALGCEEWICAHDGHIEHQAHCCRHRSCPRCQGDYTQAWLSKTQARLLPCDHYHVVFTLPHELNEVWRHNRAWSADHLYRASAETLRELLKDERYLGAEVGLVASLHTWGRTASFHPHVHVLVTGGGLSGEAWRPLQKPFLLPVGVVKAKFRGKWLSWLNAAYAHGDLELPAHWRDRDWRRALRQVARKSWNVRIQGPYRHGSGVVMYLSRYIHGGPIKDHRLVAADHRTVRFRYRDYHDGKEKLMTLKTDQFIRRVLWHVPVKGQHNVRYYGLYVPGARSRRDSVRCQLDVAPGETAEQPEKRMHACPHCGSKMAHYRSTRRKISYIRNSRPPQAPVDVVQQGVGADRLGFRWPPPQDKANIFLCRERRLN